MKLAKPLSPIGKFDIETGDFVQTEDKWECELSTGHTLIVMKGARSDGASVPSILQTALSPRFDSKSFPAAYTHDQLYASRVIPRKTADLEFGRLLLMFGFGGGKAWLYRRCVRVFGWWAWRKHTKKSVAKVRLYVSVLLTNPKPPRVD